MLLLLFSDAFENHRVSLSLILLNVPNVLNLHNVLNVLNVLNKPKDASLACWAMFFFLLVAADSILRIVYLFKNYRQTE